MISILSAQLFGCAEYFSSIVIAVLVGKFVYIIDNM